MGETRGAEKKMVKTRLWAELGAPRPGRAGAAGAGGDGAPRMARSAYLPLVPLGALSGGLGVAVLTARAGAGSGGWWDGGTAPFVAFGALAVTVSLGLLVHRRVVAPLRRLQQLAARTARGEDVQGLPAPGGGDLAPLEAAVTALAEEVVHSRRALICAAVVEGSPDLTVVLGPDGLIGHATPAADRMLGRPSAWLQGRHVGGLVHPADRPRLEELLGSSGEAAGRSYVEVRLSHLHGHWVHTEIGVLDLAEDPSVPGLVLNIRDVSARKAHEEDLVRRALHDPLTGLANRALFREHVEHALARLRRTPARPHAVLFVDLDDFKNINDSLGHAAGDEVLVEVGNRLRRWMRPGDTAARLGGDEFAILLENTSQMDTGVLAQRILQVLVAPIPVHGKEVVLTGSIGIALSEMGQDADELLRNADVAMYTAKAAGKSQYRVFEPEMHRAALRRLDLEADLRRAIDKEELFLSYQPIVDLASKAVTGMEVLVRWQHPERGLIPPLDFISVAEDSGLIRPMGRFILEQACHQAKQWQDRFPNAGPLRLCVNASVRQIEQRQFYDEVAHALDVSGLPGASLTLEITESLFMNDFEAMVQNLCRLKKLGLKLAVDDFGTGYSSLSYLRSLPVDILKIDKSFVGGVTHGPEQSAVARAVVKLARTFNLMTVAEGIEQPEQATELLAIGTDMGQGYLFSRPLQVEAMEAYLVERLAVPHGERFGSEASDRTPNGHAGKGGDGRPATEPGLAQASVVTPNRERP